MTMEPKPFASLSAGLLARKGAARPAMRRPYVPGMSVPTLPVSVQDDLGWNDMGHEDEAPEIPAPTLKMVNGQKPHDATPAQAASAEPAPAIVRQQQELAGQLAGSPERPQRPAKAVAAARKPVAMPQGRASKAAFTLRLDPERHLRLRLACAVANRSAQQIVTEALDAFLDSRPELETLAQQVPLDTGKGGKAKSK